MLALKFEHEVDKTSGEWKYLAEANKLGALAFDEFIVTGGIVQREHGGPVMSLTNNEPHFVHSLIHCHYHDKAEAAAESKYKRHKDKKYRAFRESSKQSGLFPYKV